MALCSRPLGERSVELELEDVREEITGVRRIGRHVIFCAGIEIALRPRDRRRDALVFQPQFPPALLYLSGGIFAGEYVPAPFVDH